MHDACDRIADDAYDFGVLIVGLAKTVDMEQRSPRLYLHERNGLNTRNFSLPS